jgi:transposase
LQTSDEKEVLRLNKETPFFKALWETAAEICRKAQIPLYRKTHDPKVFSTMQKVFLLLYKAKKRLTLRSLVDDLASSKVVEYLRLQRIPNFSTLSYFLTHLPMYLVQMVHEAVLTLLPDYDAVIIDSTGFECTHPSHYYCTRINTPFPIDGFMSLHVVIDQENGYIRSFKTCATKVHDSRTLKPLIKKLKKKIHILYADRGYDSEENYRFLIEEIGCLPLILQKNMLKALDRCKGIYRKIIREIFDYGEYLKRNKVESVFHCIKTRYLSTLSTKTVANQKKELALKVILYNVEKYLAAAIAVLILYLRGLFNRTKK